MPRYRTVDIDCGLAGRLWRLTHRRIIHVGVASHDLRTRLTIIKGDLSLALGRSQDPDDYRKVLTEADEEVDQMSCRVDRLLPWPAPTLMGQSYKDNRF